MNEATALLFDEYATAYRRGEAPDVVEYLARAGEDADTLAALIDRFLQAVPARPPTEEELVLVQARLEQEPPLLVLRRQRSLSRDAVVDALVKALRLDLKKRDKVAGYYHELETGLLDPEPVAGSVWDTLGAFLHANVRILAGLRPPPLAELKPLYRRSDSDFGRLHSMVEAPGSAVHERLEILPEVAPAEPPPERDEIDRLFTGTF